MATLIQVDAAFLGEINRLGPNAIQDIQVYNEIKEASVSQGPVAITDAPSAPGSATVGSSTSGSIVKQGFRPQRRYYLEGRIIHKRKLSRKLFFLDVSLVRRKKRFDDSLAKVRGSDLENPSPFGGLKASLEGTPHDHNLQGKAGVEGFKLSDWEEEEEDDDVRQVHALSDHITESAGQDPYRSDKLHHKRMEVISRFPVHSLKELDDLWRRVQLGAVIRVFGDIEVSEKQKSRAPTAVAPTSLKSDKDRGGDDVSDHLQPSKPSSPIQWSALLHCLDFEVLEVWQGQDAFEPNPGMAQVGGHHEEKKKEKDGSAIKKQDRKRKCADLVGSDSSSGVDAQVQRQRGDASQPHCKFWLNSGKCNKEQCLFWHEIDPVKLKAERRRWVEERVQAKRQISHHASDPHQKTTKNQHRERALYFAQWLIITFTRDFLNSGSGVLDVAGGRGDLSWELQTRQGIRSTIVEPRAGKGMRKWQRKWLEKFKVTGQQQQQQQPAKSESESEAGEQATSGSNEFGMKNSVLERRDDAEEREPDECKDPVELTDFIPTVLTHPLQATEPARIQAMMGDDFLLKHKGLIQEASILIGLHPDQATEPIVKAALKAGKPFAVIPCCVFGRDNPHRRLPKLPSETVSGERCDGDDTGTVLQENYLDNDEDASTTRPVTSYDDFVTWLSTLHPEIETTWLNFEGMNRVLFWRGPSFSTSSSR